MHRILTAAFAALALALIAPAAASAQYESPYFYPTEFPTPYPPVAGLQAHPFGFGGNWALDSPLEADFADYVAWLDIEADYRLRAGAYSDHVYYAYSGLIGTSFSGPTFGGVDWEVRIVRYIPPTSERTRALLRLRGLRQRTRALGQPERLHADRALLRHVHPQQRRLPGSLIAKAGLIDRPRSQQGEPAGHRSRTERSSQPDADDHPVPRPAGPPPCAWRARPCARRLRRARSRV